MQQGVWATQRSNEAKLNEAFDSAENVILIFSVNRTRHFQVVFEAYSSMIVFSLSETVYTSWKVFDTYKFYVCQGCAKMKSKIGGSIAGGNWKYAHGTAHYGRNFSVKWLKVHSFFLLLRML